MIIGNKSSPGKNMILMVMYPHVGCISDALVVILNASFISFGFKRKPMKSNDKRKSDITSNVLQSDVVTSCMTLKQNSIFNCI